MDNQDCYQKQTVWILYTTINEKQLLNLEVQWLYIYCVKVSQISAGCYQEFDILGLPLLVTLLDGATIDLNANEVSLGICKIPFCQTTN